MPSNPDIHTFAVKWFDVFRNTKAVIEDVETTAFSDECFALGFEMDCGKSFENAYPEVKAFADYRELDKIVDGITDIPLLGAAIFLNGDISHIGRVPARTFFLLKTVHGLLLPSGGWND